MDSDRITAGEAQPASTSQAAPFLSVVLTVYNMGGCLAPCLDDIKAQTFRDFELICIDDGSTDGSADVLKQAESSGAFPSLKLISQENAGPAAARNRGIEAACGAYLMLLDADDRFEPTLFARMVDAIEQADADMAICRADEFDHDSGKSRPTDWTIRTELLPQNSSIFAAADSPACPFSAFMGWPWDKIYRTSFIKDRGLRFPDLPNAEDFPFVYQALCQAQSIVVIDEVLIHHRVKRSGSTSNSRLAAPMSFYEGIEMLKSNLQAYPDAWRKLEWGFLNWALNYTCWNIESLPSGTPERAQLINALFQGGMPALELDEHPRSFFSLHADVEWCLRRLERERKTGRPCRKSPWEYLWVACHRIGKIGVSGLAGQIDAMIRHR